MVSANGPLPIIEQNYIVPIATGRTSPVTGIGTASVQAIGTDPQRRSITFHNPNVGSAQILYVCQALTAAQAALPASVDGAGMWVIYPGSSQTFLGNVGGAWNVCASAAGANLTVMTDSK